jgi:hypothetical protein
MKNSVAVAFTDNFIIVDSYHVYFENGIETLSEHENINAIYWNNGSGTVERKNGSTEDNIFDESKYNEYVAPYVEQWEREIERLKAVEEERIAEEAEAAVTNIENDIESIARYERNRRLLESDHLMLSDYPIDEETRQAVIVYRQALRDLPEQEGWPENFKWPICPVKTAAN